MVDSVARVDSIRGAIAYQLFDHEDSPSGIRASRFHSWGEGHVDEAILAAVNYLYTLLPQDFAKPVPFRMPKAGCTVSAPGGCGKLLSLLSVGDRECKAPCPDGLCDTGLASMLDIGCPTEDDTPPQYEIVGSCLIRFGKKVAKGTAILALCATNPNALVDAPSCVLDNHRGFIINWALWQLLLSDNESKSNIARAEQYWLMVRAYVSETLLMEFSLREDDYIVGRRKVDDNG